MANKHNPKKPFKSEPYFRDKMSLKSSSSRSSVGTSSILKQTPNLKRRLTEIVSSPSKVRFQMPHLKNVKKTLEAFINKGETKAYLQLICVIRDANLVDSDLKDLLSEATECISLLNQDLRLFIEALLEIKWIDQSDEVVKDYQDFIVNLVSAHNYHARYIFSKLIGLFIPYPKDPYWPEGQIPKNDRKKCLNVHTVIKSVLAVVPMSKPLLLQTLIRQYPYYNKPVHTQEYYLHNLLTILSYQPSFRDDILDLIFSKLIIMDINAPKEVLQEELIENDEIFQMDDDNDDLKSVKTINTAYTVVDRSHLGVALDVCIDMLLDYLIGQCKTEEGDFDWDKTKKVYQAVLTAFDKLVLPTYASHHIQFVMFALCALKPSLAEAFLNYLWKKVRNPNVPIVLRQASVTYIASLVARGLFITLPLVKASMYQMAEYIHAYIANQDAVECLNSDLKAHRVFYSVCQALFYLVAFRHRDLIKSKKNIIFLESLQLGKMVANRLNPLRVCQQAVVQNFAAVTRKYQLAYCYTVIDHNKRHSMPTLYRDEKGSQIVSDQTLNDFYPFDPYVLQRSGQKINPYYRHYQEDSFNGHVDVESRESDVDDFLENINDVSNPKGSYQFSYGSSPGFKFKV
ncbi:RNA polymerase I-specific transcription initiation factor RRN3 [Euwallacea fornicatus]|uniref:RNA polymerase I-specific transcription initiation factor RRN3 n=1 Tax=Euwallacea fornicatus TaxID=995702 RepID=UPI00338EBCB6